jgi:acetamidase/formamidase
LGYLERCGGRLGDYGQGKGEIWVKADWRDGAVGLPIQVKEGRHFPPPIFEEKEKKRKEKKRITVERTGNRE